MDTKESLQIFKNVQTNMQKEFDKKLLEQKIEWLQIQSVDVVCYHVIEFNNSSKSLKNIKCKEAAVFEFKGRQNHVLRAGISLGNGVLHFNKGLCIIIEHKLVFLCKEYNSGRIKLKLRVSLLVESSQKCLFKIVTHSDKEGIKKTLKSYEFDMNIFHMFSNVLEIILPAYNENTKSEEKILIFTYSAEEHEGLLQYLENYRQTAATRMFNKKLSNGTVSAANFKQLRSGVLPNKMLYYDEDNYTETASTLPRIVKYASASKVGSSLSLPAPFTSNPFKVSRASFKENSLNILKKFKPKTT